MPSFTLPSWGLPANSLPFRTLDPGSVIRTKEMRAMDPDFLENLAEDSRKMLEITRGRYQGGVLVAGSHDPDKVFDAVE